MQARQQDTRALKMSRALEDLKTVDIEHTDQLRMLHLRCHGLVDTRNDPLEQVVVKSLGQGVTTGSGLCGI